MKLLSLTLLFSLLIAGSFGTENVYHFDPSRLINMSDVEHPGKCFYEGLILSEGEEGRPQGKCELVMCGAKGYGSIDGCDQYPIILEPPCWWGDVENPDATFPDCCMRKVICPERSDRRYGYGRY
ncbi:uncharacterized protein [Musca autumnalis]|uniref:uncharacterized protein n=1 Tax=Musca autumnalis TaxID=221902 RepID=UPI003CFB9894